MTQLLTLAQDKGDHETASRIQEIVAWEQQRQQFAILRRATGQPQSRSVASVQVKQYSITTEVHTEEEVLQAIISEVHDMCYTLASTAPICNSSLFQDFGYMSLSTST